MYSRARQGSFYADKSNVSNKSSIDTCFASSEDLKALQVAKLKSKNDDKRRKFLLEARKI